MIKLRNRDDFLREMWDKMSKICHKSNKYRLGLTKEWNLKTNQIMFQNYKINRFNRQFTRRQSWWPGTMTKTTSLRIKFRSLAWLVTSLDNLNPNSLFHRILTKREKVSAKNNKISVLFFRRKNSKKSIWSWLEWVKTRSPKVTLLCNRPELCDKTEIDQSDWFITAACK